MSRFLFRFPCLILLAGCYDFAGENERLGFSTDLTLGVDGAWTPEHPVALGSAVSVVAGRLEGEDPEGTVYVGSTAGDLSRVGWAEGELSLRADRVGRGSVRFDGPTWDRFGMTVVPAREALVVDPLREHFEEPATDRYALVSGEQVGLSLALLDAEQRLLGWNPEDITVEVDGPFSAWMEGAELVVVGDHVVGDHVVGDHVVGDGGLGEQGRLSVRLGDDLLGEVELELAEPADAARVSLVSAPLDEDHTVWGLLVELEDGTPLLGTRPEWTGATPEADERGDVVLVEADANGAVRAPVSATLVSRPQRRR